jgi:hypothetical protein
MRRLRRAVLSPAVQSDNGRGRWGALAADVYGPMARPGGNAAQCRDGRSATDAEDDVREPLFRSGADCSDSSSCLGRV